MSRDGKVGVLRRIIAEDECAVLDSVAEFSEVLEDVLQGFGYSVGELGPAKKKKSKPVASLPCVRNSNINEMIPDAEGGLELTLYKRLRCEMDQLLKESPDELRGSSPGGAEG